MDAPGPMLNETNGSLQGRSRAAAARQGHLCHGASLNQASSYRIETRYYACHVFRQAMKKVIHRVAVLAGISDLRRRTERIENELLPNVLRGDALSNLERRIIDLSLAQFEERLMAVNEAIVNHISINNQEFGANIEQRLLEIKLDVDTVRRLSNTNATTPLTVTSESISAVQSAPIDDSLYIALENRFRGSRELITTRQRDYLPHLPDVINESAPLVDLGCGRGEWLHLLREYGVPSIGIDANSVAVAECLEADLNVTRSDIMEFLTRRPDHSVGTFTLFQVLEHLPFPMLVEVLREMRRVLVPGGRVIAEVPNARNISVSAGTFWLDPTHLRPLFPDLLLFLAREVGFAQAEGLYVNNLGPTFDLSDLPEGAKQALQSVVTALYGPGDFALVATA